MLIYFGMVGELFLKKKDILGQTFFGTFFKRLHIFGHNFETKIFRPRILL